MIAALKLIAAVDSPTVTAEIYPYRAMATTIQSAYFDPGWRERYGITYSDITFVETGESLTAETFDDIRLKGGMVVARSIPEFALKAAIRDPAVAIAADAVGGVRGAVRMKCTANGALVGDSRRLRSESNGSTRTKRG